MQIAKGQRVLVQVMLIIQLRFNILYVILTTKCRLFYESSRSDSKLGLRFKDIQQLMLFFSFFTDKAICIRCLSKNSICVTSLFIVSRVCL